MTEETPGWHLRKEITVGQIASIVVVTIAGLGAYYDVRQLASDADTKAIAALEELRQRRDAVAQIGAIDQRVTKNEAAVTKLTDFAAAIARIDERSKAQQEALARIERALESR